MSHWTVVQLEPRMLAQTKRRGHASMAEELMRRAGFETYVPRVKVRRRGGAKRGVPLFPGYLFARVVDRWYDILWMPGVLRVLMAGERPAVLMDSVIDAIRGAEWKGYVRLPPALRKGRAVRVVGGQFAGHIGLYEGQSHRERERVLLELLGQQVRVELGRNDRVEVM